MRKQQQQPKPPPQRLWTAQQTAEFLGVPVSTMYWWSYCGEGGPRLYRVGRHLRYDPNDVMAWLETRAA